ncbi:MAG: hypothetical protein ACRES7_10985 [Gammaproteobacteria bacterium]
MKEPMKAHGKPHSLEYVIPQPLRQGVAAFASFKDKRGEIVPIVFAKPFGRDATRVRLKFPPDTPPGSYSGTVRIGDATHAATVEVTGEARVRISPSSVRLSGTSGQRFRVELSAVNEGNAACRIETAYGVGLFAEGGVEDALGAAYRKSEHGGQERVAILADKLASAHGGLMRVQIEDGAGDLAPNEVRTLCANVRLPDNLKPGRLYTGALKILNAQCEFRIDVPDSTGEEKQ